MARGIQLTRYQQASVFLPNRGEGFRLKIVATEASLMPKAIFLHAKRLVNPDTGATGEDFTNVCSVPDLTTYPENEPDVMQNPPFYRKDTIDVICDSQHQADELWSLIKEEVCILRASLDKFDVLVQTETYECGELPEEASSVSDSESFSTSISESVAE